MHFFLFLYSSVVGDKLNTQLLCQRNVFPCFGNGDVKYIRNYSLIKILLNENLIILFVYGLSFSE